MCENLNQDMYYIGVFRIGEVDVPGELIHNEKKGIILIKLTKKFDIEKFDSGNYGFLPIIVGTLNIGAKVTLFDNNCVADHTQLFISQQIIYSSKYMIWSNIERSNAQYNKMVCSLKNAFKWSCMSALEGNSSELKVKDKTEKKSYNWFGANITFYIKFSNNVLLAKREEETKVTQRLIVEIETDEKKNINEFISIRNRIISLISFAIRNNVNIEKQYLLDYNDFYFVTDNHKIYYKHDLYISEPTLDILISKNHKYNFKLKDLPEKEDISAKLEKLEPVFNLYLSFVKYNDMPNEMIFLNVVQALETFHSRFFYDNSKEKYVEHINKRFGDSGKYNKLLLSDTQIDKNCRYIILVSRLNDLLIGEDNGLFHEYYIENDEFAQTVADTRHYYTHYSKSKEQKALKGTDLLEAIYILRLLLEYHVCRVLEINNYQDINQELAEFNKWKQLSQKQS